MFHFNNYKFDIYDCNNFPYDGVACLIRAVRGKGIHRAKDGRWNALQVCAFDIETTIIGNDKRTAMFHWQFSYNNEFYCIGRTWSEFSNFMRRLNDAVSGYYLTICVHNLSYEAQYMLQPLREEFGHLEALMMSAHEFLNITVDNLKFIDTLKMSGTSLAKMCKDYNLFYQKSKDLDYDKRFSVETHLTDAELAYCLLDVASLVEWYHVIEAQRGYTTANMPITKTAFIRTPLRKVMKPLKADYYTPHIDSYEVFKLLREMFQGGLTAINHMRRCNTIEADIRCKDFTSSYPAVMLGENYYYPVTAYSKYADVIDVLDDEDYEAFLYQLQTACCLFTVSFTHLRLKDDYICPIIASSKCRCTVDYEGCQSLILNGKVYQAGLLTKVVNEIEFSDIIEMYDFETIEIEDVYTSVRGKLPEQMRDYIANLFRMKTQYKKVDGKELDLLLAKADLNSIYGCTAMNPLRTEFELQSDFIGHDKLEHKSPDTLDSINMERYEKIVHKGNAFLHYRTGCYVTSWARHNIIKAMNTCGENWLYTDTDSIYYIYSDDVDKKLEALNDYFTHGQMSVTNEKNGFTDTLGMLCDDGKYTAFRGLGAKKYVLQYADGHLKLTCAGVPKKAGTAMLKSIDDFQHGFVFDGVTTNKLTPVRNFEEWHQEDVNGVMTWTGNNIYMSKTDYVLSDSIFDDLIREQFDDIVLN